MKLDPNSNQALKIISLAGLGEIGLNPYQLLAAEFLDFALRNWVPSRRGGSPKDNFGSKYEKQRIRAQRTRLCAAPRGGFNGLSLMRPSAGVMECWSKGVMIIQLESRTFAFANTPILQ